MEIIVGHMCHSTPGYRGGPHLCDACGLPIRFNVDHLSTGKGDHRYAWRSSLPPYPLIQWGRWPDCPFWVIHEPDGIWWHKLANVAVASREGERFIRVGRVIP